MARLGRVWADGVWDINIWQEAVWAPVQADPPEPVVSTSNQRREPTGYAGFRRR